MLCVEAGSEPLELLLPGGVVALPNQDVVVSSEGDGESKILLCTPGFKVKRVIMHHGDLKLGSGADLQCDADTVFAYASRHIVSFKASDLSPLRRSDVYNCTGRLAISSNNVYASTRDNQIVVLDKASLVERSRFGEGMLANINAMTVHGDQLYLSDSGNEPHARVHIFSLQGELCHTVNLADVWSICDLTAANGRLFATEWIDPYLIEDEAVIERALADMGKCVLTISPQLEVLNEFRGEGVPGEHDFTCVAPRGDNELLVTNHDCQAIHVLSM